MKRLFKFWLFVVSSLVIVGVARAQTAQNNETTPNNEVLPLTFFQNLRAGKPQTVVVYGTSLTHYGRWTVAMKDYLAANFGDSVTFINAARAGMTSDWGVANFESRVLSQKPDLVFIEFSANDAATKHNISLEKSRANLEAMVKALRAQNPRADLVLHTTNPAWDSPRVAPKQYGSERPQIAQYNAVYRDYAREKGLPLVDNFPVWQKIQTETPERFQKMVPDGIHPSSTSSVAVTWKAMEPLLEKTKAAAGFQTGETRAPRTPKETAPNEATPNPPNSHPGTPNEAPQKVIIQKLAPVEKIAPVENLAPVPTASDVTLPARENFHIYLLMGQSNMVGRDTKTLDADGQSPRVLALGEDGVWKIAKNPLQAQVGRIAVGVGPGLTFGLQMASANPKVTIGLVPTAVGGTPLKRWVRGGDLYHSAIKQGKLAAQKGVLKGVLWLQGETDAGQKSTSENYSARLEAMLAALRADLETPDLPVVVGQIGSFVAVEKFPGADQVREQIAALPGRVKNVGFADSQGLIDKGDALHYDAASAREMGKRMAAAMQKLQK